MPRNQDAFGCAIVGAVGTVGIFGMFFALLLGLALWAKAQAPTTMAFVTFPTFTPTSNQVAMVQVQATAIIPTSIIAPLPTDMPIPVAVSTDTPAPIPTDTPIAVPFDSGGLGQPQSWWDNKFGNGTKNGIGYTVYGDYEVMFSSDNVMLIDRQREIPVDQETILAEAALLIPADSQLIDTYSPSGRPEATALLYMSESLKTRFDENSFTGGEPGNFIVLFNTYEQGITRLIIARGNNP